MEKTVSTRTATVSLALALAFAVPICAAALPPSVTGGASDALVTLATTGNPDPLHAELGGTVISSDELQKKVGSLLKLEKQEQGCVIRAMQSNARKHTRRSNSYIGQ